MDPIHLNRSGDHPLYLQVAAAIRQAIQDGRIPGGSKLPPTRTGAIALGVNRSTVVEAYRWLREAGWVRSGVGSGTFVVDRPEDGRGGEKGDSKGFWAPRLAGLPRPQRPAPSSSGRGDTIRFVSPTADPAGFPIREFREVLDEVLRRRGAEALDYGPPDGYGPLRELLAARLAEQGVQVDPSRVVLVNGSQQGLELIFRLLVPPGRTLLLEEPTYQLAIRTARALGLAARSIPMDAEGLRVEILRKILDEGPAGMLYMMPVFQNPTGITLSPARRRDLLRLSAERGLPIVEDHFDADLDYGGDAPGPLLGEGAPPNVVLLGTFSKILFPGLRVGWLVVPEPLLGPLSEMKVCADLSGGLLTQIALHEFCARGHLDAHIERVRAANASRLRAMLEALEREMPEGVAWTRPSGGMTLWLHLPGRIEAPRLAQRALERGVAVNPGSLFHLDAGGRDGLRLCFVRETEERIADGIRVLASLVREEIARRPAGEIEPAAAPIL